MPVCFQKRGLGIAMAVKKSLFPENHPSNPDIEDLILGDCGFQNDTSLMKWASRVCEEGD